MSSLARRALYLGVAAAITVLDQVTKAIVDREMELHESRPLIDGFLSLTYVRNRGAAFGILADADLPYQAAVFSVVSLLALAAIVAYALRLPVESRLPQGALALVTGGALGNLIDRWRHGYVIDFVDAYWRSHHWPAFNVADAAISVGVVLLVLDLVFWPEPGTEPTVASGSPAGD